MLVKSIKSAATAQWGDEHLGSKLPVALGPLCWKDKEIFVILMPGSPAYLFICVWEKVNIRMNSCSFKGGGISQECTWEKTSQKSVFVFNLTQNAHRIYTSPGIAWGPKNDGKIFNGIKCLSGVLSELVKLSPVLARAETKAGSRKHKITRSPHFDPLKDLMSDSEMAAALSKLLSSIQSVTVSAVITKTKPCENFKQSLNTEQRRGVWLDPSQLSSKVIVYDWTVPCNNHS